MRAFVNEFALVEACQASIPSHSPFLLLLADRQNYQLIKERLFCSRLMGNQLVDEEPLRNIMMRLPRDERKVLLIWIDQNGPYFDDDPLGKDGDLYIWRDEDVTKMSLGEAAANVRVGNHVSLFSRGIGEGSVFDCDSLSILRVLDNDKDIALSVDNYRDPVCLNAALEKLEPALASWHELIERCGRFERLHVSSECLVTLKPHPFSSNIAEKAVLLLRVLDQMMSNRDADGNWLPEAWELYETYFKGHSPRFTDESEQNKIDFFNEMTFLDPLKGEYVTCFWHGKIREREFRVHFSWPPAAKDKYIRIPYIGPKISKH